MADATLGGLPTRAFPSSGASLRWEHILPWLSRDQECRFADFRRVATQFGPAR